MLKISEPVTNHAVTLKLEGRLIGPWVAELKKTCEQHLATKQSINLDFADVKTVMHGMGMALMGTGAATGENRAVEAAKRAISSRLLEEGSIQGAKGVLINITGGHDLGLHEVGRVGLVHDRDGHRSPERARFRLGGLESSLGHL